MKQQMLFFALWIGIVSCSVANAASSGPYGFWGYIGMQMRTNASTSDVSYIYTNKYAGSTNPPGFALPGEYKMTDTRQVIQPTLGLRYVTSFFGMILGISASGVYHSGTDISTEKFNIANPTGTGDSIYGMTMATKVSPAFDFDFALEPAMMIGPDTLAYLKLAYHQMNAEVKTETTMTGGIWNPIFTEVKRSYRFVGVGAGIGLRFSYSSNVYIEPLMEYVFYEPQKISGSSMISYADEATMTQEQEVKLHWNSFSLMITRRF